VHDLLQTGMTVFCHGQHIAQISIPLSTSGTCWIGGWGIGTIPPEMSGNLQVTRWKSGVTSHSKNLQIWCRPWGDSQQYLVVATPDTVTFDFDPHPLCSGTHYYIAVSLMSVELVQFMSQLLNLVMSKQIFTHVKFIFTKHSWQREDVSFFCCRV
jgi:hypothetical protein